MALIPLKDSPPETDREKLEAIKRIILKKTSALERLAEIREIILDD